MSPELLSQAASAPVAFVVRLSGPPGGRACRGPALRPAAGGPRGQVHELPATSYRLDYDGVMATLGLIEAAFAS